MSEKNQKNLSEYLMLNRPSLSDLYAIYDSLFHVLISEGHGENIVFNIEYIYYDRKRKKIRFKYRFNFYLCAKLQTITLCIGHSN